MRNILIVLCMMVVFPAMADEYLGKLSENTTLIQPPMSMGSTGRNTLPIASITSTGNMARSTPTTAPAVPTVRTALTIATGKAFRFMVTTTGDS